MKLTKKMLCIAGFAVAVAGCATPPRHTVCRVEGLPESRSASGLSDAVVSGVRGDLARLGYHVSAEKRDICDNDVSVNIAIDRKEAARLDIWVAYDATAGVKVVAGRGGQILGEKTFAARGVRGRTEKEAEAGIRKSLVEQINAWLPSVLPPVVITSDI